MIAEALTAAAQRLAAVSDSPRLDAELLLAHVAGCGRSALVARAETALDERSRERFDGLLARRAQGIPLAYLLGRREFWSLEFEVNEDVLVPRPETELLVEWGLECLVEHRGPRILDMGTGSGCIAVALAHERRDAEVAAIDASPAALEVARRNADRHRVPVGFRLASFADVASDRPFDLVVANPPYVTDDDPHLARLRHEPEMALVSAGDGLRALREVVTAAKRLLAPGGWLLLEHGAEQGGAVRDLLGAAGFARVSTRRDLAGLERASGGRS